MFSRRVTSGMSHSLVSNLINYILTRSTLALIARIELCHFLLRFHRMETTQHLLLGCSISSRAILALQTITIIVVFASLHCFLKRLYFHSLSKIPGPRLAAATFWYEFYYNVIRDGTYIKRFPQLHTRYS